VLVPTIVYAFLGMSRTLSVTTTTTLGILTAAKIAEIGPNASPEQAVAIASTLAVTVGVALALAGILRLGFVAQFISEPVLTGFKAGIGLVIVVDQLPKLIGAHYRGSLAQNIASMFAHLQKPTRRCLAVATSRHGRPGRLAPSCPRHWLRSPVAPAPRCSGSGGRSRTSASFGGTQRLSPNLTLFADLWPRRGIALMTSPSRLRWGARSAGRATCVRRVRLFALA
jgi:hypothetical protein